MRNLLTVVFMFVLAVKPVLAQPVQESEETLLDQYPGQGSRCHVFAPAFFQFQRLHFAVRAVGAQLAVLNLPADVSPRDVKKAQDKLKRAEGDYLWARGVELRHYKWMMDNWGRQIASAEARLKALEVLEFRTISALLLERELKRKLAVLRVVAPRLWKVAEGTADLPWVQMSKEELMKNHDKEKEQKNRLRSILVMYPDFFWVGGEGLIQTFYYECAPYATERQNLDRVGL